MENDREGQDLQDVEPVIFWNFPATHSVQGGEPVAEKAPTPQTSARTDDATDKKHNKMIKRRHLKRVAIVPSALLPDCWIKQDRLGELTAHCAAHCVAYVPNLIHRGNERLVDRRTQVNSDNFGINLKKNHLRVTAKETPKSPKSLLSSISIPTEESYFATPPFF